MCHYVSKATGKRTCTAACRCARWGASSCRQGKSCRFSSGPHRRLTREKNTLPLVRRRLPSLCTSSCSRSTSPDASRPGAAPAPCASPRPGASPAPGIKKAPRARGWSEGHALFARQAPNHFSRAFPIDTETNHGAIAGVHGPVARLAVPFYAHRMCSPRAMGAARVPCP
jgi:hypothetical protein